MGDKSPKVVDFSTHFSGPVASRQLVQLGADVVKIEPPGYGDGNRGTPPFVDGESVIHGYLNVGTRSIVADTRSEGWRELVAAAANWADVVIVGNRPSAARKRGMDFEMIRSYRSDTVYCQITGYGLAGPWSTYPAHGLQMDALAGVVPVEWTDGRPLPPENIRSVGTTLAGIEAALGIYAALHSRDREGTAQYVHVSVWEAALAWMWRDLSTYSATGNGWGSYRDMGPRYRMYGTADDRAILVCPLERHFWGRFCDVIGMPPAARDEGDWSTGMDFGSDESDETEQIASRMATRTLAEWQKLLTEAEVPFAPVLDWREAYTSDHAAANGVRASYEHGDRRVEIPTTPVSVSSMPESDRADIEQLASAHRRKGEKLRRPPALGEQTEDILREFGVPGLAESLAFDGQRD